MSTLFDDLGKIIGGVAPAIAGALGAGAAGPAGGALARAGVSAVMEALDLRPQTPDTELLNAVAAATPEQMAAMKAADRAFKVRMAELGVASERIAADDRRSARALQSVAGGRSVPVLSGVIIAAFFLVLLTLSRWPVPENNAALVFAMAGALATMATQVVAFFFGSSAGSRAKTDLLGREK